MDTADDGTPETTPTLARSLDGHKVSSLALKRAARSFLDEYSTLDSLRSCSRIYLKQQRTWSRCESALCLSCSRQRANRAGAELRTLAMHYPVMISMRTSLSTSASLSLSDLWDGLDLSTKTFVGGRWLTRRAAAFRRHTEITKPPAGWNPHHHWVLALDQLLPESKFMNLKAELAGRWAAAAASAGHHADPEAFHFERVTTTPGRFLTYITKGPMARHDGSRTAGEIFLDAALRHDAEAAADWLEIENASVGRKWQATGGEFRARSPRAAELEPPKAWSWDDILDGELDPPRPAPRPQVPYTAPTDRKSDDRREATRRRFDERERLLALRAA